MSEISKLLRDLKNDDKKVKLSAAEKLGEVGGTQDVVSALKSATNDKDGKVKRAASDSLTKVQARMARKTKGEPWRSSTTEETSSQYEITEATEVKTESEDALRILLTETQKGTIQRDGGIYTPTKDDDPSNRPKFSSTGLLSIKNSGETDRIWDIDVEVKKPGSSNLENAYHINELSPQEEWKQEYEIKGVDKTLSLTFSETIDTFPEVEKESPSNVLVFGQSMKTNIQYKIKAVKDLLNISFEKTVPAHFGNLSVQKTSSGKPSIDGSKLVWNIPKLGKEQDAELTLSCVITVQDIEVKRTGEARLSYYSDQEGAFSSVDVFGADGLTKNSSYIEATEMEEQPDTWQCKLVFDNRSEFPVELRDIKVSKSDEVFIMHEFGSGEHVIPTGKTWESETWTVVSNLLPSFEKNVTFTVKPEILYKASSELSVVDTEMRVANVKASKAYETAEVASYREVPVGTTIEAQNIGSLAFKTLTINDKVPKKFRPAATNMITVTVGESADRMGKLRSGDYEVTYEPAFSEGEEQPPERTMKLKINKSIEPSQFIKLEYTPTIVKAFPDETFSGIAQIVAELAEPGPNLVRDVEDWLSASSIAVVHRRKALTFGKTVAPGAQPKIYEISLVYKNRGKNALTDVRIRDIIPEGFRLLDDSMKSLADEESVPEGSRRVWTFEKIEPEQEINIVYRIKGESDEFHAGQTQLSVL